VYIRNLFILNSFFLGAFCLKGKFIFLKSTLNSASFDTHKAHIMKKKFGPLYTVVLDPEKNDLSSEGHLTKTLFIAVFGIFTYK
jgi:hypothetical protein